MRIFPLLLLVPMALLYAQKASHTLDGDIIDSITGAPVASARVKLGSLYGAADARGHFHFDNLSPTTYTLSVDHPGYLAANPIRIGAKQSTVRVPLTAGGIIYGVVTDPNGLPALAGVGFLVLLFEQRPIDSRSLGGQPLPDGKNELVKVGNIESPDDRGQYRSSLLAPGIYYVGVISQRAPDFWDRTWRSTYYPHALDVASAKAIQVQAGAQVRADVQLISQTGVHVSGRVTIPAYDPPPGTMTFTNVHLAPRGAFLSRSSGNSGIVDGRFEADDLLPGKYTLMAETTQMSADGAGRDQKPVFGIQREVEIGERDLSGLDLELQPLAEVTGKVTFDAGCAAGPVPVHLRGGGMMGVQEDSVVSAADGSFAFAAFTPSSLFISAGAPGMATVFLGDIDITKTGFDYPSATPEPLRIVIHCAAGGGQ
ncbi:MAG TPA: carboxypeptidase-like regulatory domain-containing protein [Bryobacteraceae bacterium]|jgi:hypothetical protein|nr:carboxypeptidase-like regulatory domain-containing protein [Bryobacteraceae bacterium]